MEETEKTAPLLLGKFESAEALAKAYRELEEELSRRNQTIERYESAAREKEREKEQREEVYRAASADEAVKARILSDYLKEREGVPLMTTGGSGLISPPVKARSFDEAGKLALGYFKNPKN